MLAYRVLSAILGMKLCSPKIGLATDDHRGLFFLLVMPAITTINIVVGIVVMLKHGSKPSAIRIGQGPSP